MIDPIILHAPHIAGKLSAAERKSRQILTGAEAIVKHAARLERAIHDDLRQFLQLKQIPFVTSTFGRKGTLRVGWPDFTCLFKGRACCVELKCPGQKLKPEQEQVAAELEKAKVPFAVCTSSQEAIQFIISELLT